MAESTLVPIADPNRGFKVWHIDEIYAGENGPGRYVPNERDLVISYIDGWLRVINVDYTTGLSELQPVDFARPRAPRKTWIGCWAPARVGSASRSGCSWTPR